MSPHKSLFSYNVTQPYPFKWFTPVVVIGFVCATALFSFLNFVANGYYLVNEVSTDPNATISRSTSVRNMPSFFASKVQATCQPTLLAPEAVVFTNQTALTYTITSIARPVGDDIISSLEYHNNVLENCSISNIDIDLQSFDRLANQLAFNQWGVFVRTYLRCDVHGADGIVTINMTHGYDYEPDTLSYGKLYTFLGTGFLKRNRTMKPGLWWGESLMSWYWIYISNAMQIIRSDKVSAGEAPIRKGTLSFSRNEEVTDVTSLHFFDIDYRLIIENEDFSYNFVYPGDYGESRNVADLDKQQAYPNIWIPADSLAKSTYYTVLTDLGQKSVVPNILNDQNLLEHFTANFSLVQEQYSFSNARPGPADAPFDPENDTINNTASQIPSSVISASYLCQVPKMKSAGNLLMSILIADLVFLQALWTVFVLIVDSFMLKNEKRAAHGDATNQWNKSIHGQWRTTSEDEPGYDSTPIDLSGADGSTR